MIIETKGLTTYYGKARGIENIDLDIKEGEIYGFVGPNGAGKSTLMRTLLSFINPLRGEARIFGLDYRENSKEIKKSLGYVPGEIKYYPDTRVSSLLSYSASLKGAGRDQVSRLAKLLGLEENKRIRELSLGNKKKVALAQAFLGEPKLLILDEPTSGLDPLLQRIFSDLILDFQARGGTVFLSSHNLQEVAHLCHRTSVIKEGFIVDTLDLKAMENEFGWIVGLKGSINKEAVLSVAKELLKEEDGYFEFLYRGQMDSLVRSLGVFKLDDLSIRKEDIQDRFLRYYGGDYEGF